MVNEVYAIRMKITDATKFYPSLGVICIIISALLLIRKLIKPLEVSLELVFPFFWPLVGVYIFVSFLKKDGYTISSSEICFIIFIFYCAVYFPIAILISVLNFAAAENFLLEIVLNLLITFFGWLGVLYYRYF